jgi:hypothetical protein
MHAFPVFVLPVIAVILGRRRRAPGGCRVSSSPSTKGEVAPPAHGTASDQQPAGRGGDGPTASWVEVVATVVLALAAVATAWSATRR